MSLGWSSSRSSVFSGHSRVDLMISYQGIPPSHPCLMQLIQLLIDGLQACMESGFLMLSEVLESYELLNGDIVVLNSGKGDVERHLDHVLLACHLFVDSRNGCNGK